MSLSIKHSFYCLNCDRFLKPEQLEHHKEILPHHIIMDKLKPIEVM